MGSLTLEPGDGPAIRTDLDLWMAAAGLRGTVLDGGNDGLTLTAKTDAMIVQTSTDAVSGSSKPEMESSVLRSITSSPSVKSVIVSLPWPAK